VAATDVRVRRAGARSPRGITRDDEKES